ncbi:MAG: UDP-3-O-(3-hydroxymyristoyl)glucosamine N-acyltransferase [Deltaproteobacteria bacterium]|nr:UDP-3-O-(3-hydroxymyristoyl)glucosamine N-acyltransferase [Deltaproteobacteria bacterium]
MAVTLDDLARETGGRVVGEGSVTVLGVAELASAGPSEIAPFTDPRRAEEARGAVVAALLVTRHWPELRTPQLVCPDAGRALALIIRIFAPAAEVLRSGVDPRAAVEPGAVVEPGAWVGPFVFVGAGAHVEAGAQVEPFSYVGARARVGAGARVGPGAVVGEGCEIGPAARVGPGAIVGGSGFGFYREEGAWRAVPQLGSVVIEAEAELGANSCVDRGTLGATRVGAGAKLDNLVQVGHNASIGCGALLCGQVGVAGSAVVGAGAVLAGQVGVADHVRVGEGARVGAHSGVAQDVPPGTTVTGYPTVPHVAWLRTSAALARLPQLLGRVTELGRRVELLEQRAISCAAGPQGEEEDAC